MTVTLFILALCVPLCSALAVFFARRYYKKRIELLKEQLNLTRHLEDETRNKINFFAIMSHEIRTPLNAIIGLTDLELIKKPQGETKENLEKISMAGTALLSVINDILDFSKIEAQQFEIVTGEYDTIEMISEPVALNLLRIGKKPVKFELNCSPTLPARLYGDEKHLKQVLNNILSNAIKYTKEGRVTLTVDWNADVEYKKSDTIGRRTTGMLSFKVEDTGIGINPESIGAIFNAYSQTDTFINRSIEGTGLGLYITKKLIELMYGFINVQSVYGSGSTFKVEVRQESGNMGTIGADAAFRLAALKFKTDDSKIKFLRSKIPWGRVLVVDDIELNLHVARGMLAPYEIKCDCVLSGTEAIEAFYKAYERKEEYHIIFMDHLMPKMNGIETAKNIRALDLDYAKAVPIIALTANTNSGTEDFFLQAGFNGYLSKPIDLFQLDIILHRYIPERIQNLQGSISSQNKNNAPKFLCEDFENKTGINVKDALERFESESVYLLIIQSYCNSSPVVLDRLTELFNSGVDLKEYAIMVHGIKGAARGISDTRAGELAGALEFAAKNNDAEFVKLHHQEFCEWMKEHLETMKTALSNYDLPDPFNGGGG